MTAGMILQKEACSEGERGGYLSVGISHKHILDHNLENVW